MRLVTYNIRLGGRRRVDPLGEIVAGLSPDVVVLQEATLPGVVHAIAERAGLDHVAVRPGVSLALLSRNGIHAADWHRLPRSRTFLEFEIDGSDLRFIGLHLPAGLSRRGEAARSGFLDALFGLVGPRSDDRTILVGDLNAVGRGDAPVVAAMPRWLRLLLRFDGGIRTDVMDRLIAAGWVDVFRRLHPDEAGFTLPAVSPQVRLDYVLAPEAVLPRIRACAPGAAGFPAANASDHLPLITDIDDIHR